METANTPASAASLLKEAEEMVETRLQYARLKLIDKSASISGAVMVVVALCLVAVGFLLAVSFALAYFISARTGSPPAGFFAVGGFYLLMLIVVLIFRTRLIRNPLTNAMISNIAK